MPVPSSSVLYIMIIIKLTFLNFQNFLTRESTLAPGLLYFYTPPEKGLSSEMFKIVYSQKLAIIMSTACTAVQGMVFRPFGLDRL